MDEVKGKKKSLKLDFVKYFFVCAVFIFIGSIFINAIADEFITGSTDGYRVFVGGEHKVYMDINYSDDSKKTYGKYFLSFNVADLLQFAATTLWVLSCVAVSGIIFYRRKIEKPVRILLTAAENISDHRLDFSVEIPEPNELGELCLSFEKMRSALSSSYHEMWRQVEERKRLNAAFSHDLRTPLTVLKGQSEMIIKYAPKMSEEKIIAAAKAMKRHIERLENYVNKMNELQRLEDIEIQKQSVLTEDFITQMRETGASICHTKEFEFQDHMPDARKIQIDVSVVMQVYENLLANAVRFADRRITVSIELQDDLLFIAVEDDGAGFTARDLEDAVKPFYTRERYDLPTLSSVYVRERQNIGKSLCSRVYKSDAETDLEHFGMGLNICKILCEKHGGWLELSNHGGANAAAAFGLV